MLTIHTQGVLRQERQSAANSLDPAKNTLRWSYDSDLYVQRRAFLAQRGASSSLDINPCPTPEERITQLCMPWEHTHT